MSAKSGIVKQPGADRAVLLVEDNHDDAHFFRHAFRAAGFENPLHTVNDCDEARRYLSGEAQYADRAEYPLPHMLVIDTVLEGNSDFECLKWVREQPQFKDLVAIMLSGDGGPQEEAQATRLGANAYHHKPSSLPELQTLIRRVGDFWLLGSPSAET